MLQRPELSLTGYEVESDEIGSLAARTCTRHLELLGAARRVGGAPWTGESETIVLRSSDDAAAQELSCEIAWPAAMGRDARDTWREVALQATSGLMAVHGLDHGRPRRLGLDVVSNALGVVACQALLAAMLARARGLHLACASVQPAGAALLMLAHHLAAATCGDTWRPPVGGAAPGPPFSTSDGHHVELEVLDPDRWGSFWTSLGVPAGELGTAWLAFAFRHVTGTCHLPAALHEATRRCSLEQLRRAADGCGVSLVVLRGYVDVSAAWHAAAQRPWTLRSLEPDGNNEATRSWSPGRAPGAVAAPLAGLRIIDATTRIQGPLAARVLAQLGADVVHIEPPGGEPARDAPPTAGSVGAAYLTYNHGKRVVELDYKTRAGRAELFDLVAGADVFMHNWPAGRAAALRLGAGDLTQVRADLVYAHATGWGDVSEAMPEVATDFLVQAYAGCGDGLNPEGEQPFPSRLTLVDVTGGLVAAEGILAGLLARERTGGGCMVNTSLLGSALDMQYAVFDGIASGGEIGRRLGRPVWTALDQPLQTADGCVVVDATDEVARRGLARVLRVDVVQPEAIVRAIRPQTTATLIAELRALNVPCEPLRTQLSGLSADAMFAGAVQRIEGACDVVGSPWCFRHSHSP